MDPTKTADSATLLGFTETPSTSGRKAQGAQRVQRHGQAHRVVVQGEGLLQGHAVPNEAPLARAKAGEQKAQPRRYAAMLGVLSAKAPPDASTRAPGRTFSRARRRASDLVWPRILALGVMGRAYRYAKELGGVMAVKKASTAGRWSARMRSSETGRGSWTPA